MRGLLFRARGDLVGAERQFRAAIFCPVGGFTRTNLELAEVLIAQFRAAEAVPLLRAALRAPLDGSALYGTRTELHLALGRAHEAAGRADSAATHYRLVIVAWSGADALLEPRRARRERAARLADGAAASRPGTGAAGFAHPAAPGS